MKTMREGYPLVSAIITTHNRASLLPRALDSVLNQTYPYIEIIVIDDGSTDNTQNVIKSYVNKYPAIISILNEQSMGACYGRNMGFKRASGKFVTGLDDDDEWLPQRIERFVEEYRPSMSMIGAGSNVVLEMGEVEFMPHTPGQLSVINLDDMLYKNVFGNQAFIERERMLELNGFDESLPSAQDYDMWLRVIEKFGSAVNIQEALQNIFVDHNCNRITLSTGKFSGYFLCYRKHKHLMSRSHRRFQLFTLYRARGKRMSLITMLILIDKYSFRFVARYYLMKSPIKDKIKKILSR
jgi:glycosyltransferase involved in cell wall biosynthesis